MLACLVVTTTLMASSTRSRAQRSAVGRSASGNVCMGVNFGRIESLFRHQRHCPAGGAAAFAANAVDIDIVLYEMREIRRDGVVRKTPPGRSSRRD
jgi:hypothetical protein